MLESDEGWSRELWRQYAELGLLGLTFDEQYGGAGMGLAELAVVIRKATSPDETAPKRKHVRSCIVYTWDHKSSVPFWTGIKVYVPPLRSPKQRVPQTGPEACRT